MLMQRALNLTAHFSAHKIKLGMVQKTPYILHQKKKWKNIDFHEILFAFKSFFLPIFSVSLTIVQNPL